MNDTDSSLTEPLPQLLRRNMPLIPEMERSDTFLDKITFRGQNGRGYPIAFGAVGMMGVLLCNWNAGIPMFARIYRHILATGGGYWLGGVADYYRTRFNAERDAALHHYISLHPEDFQEEVPPKLKYVLYPWVPIRESWDGLKGYALR